MKKKLGFSFLMLIILILSASAVLAEEAEDEIIIAGIELCAILSTVAVVVFGIAAVMTFKLVKKLYGGRFTAVLPYLLMAVMLLLGMQVLCLIGDFARTLGESALYLHGIQVLQLLAGFFLISALYQIYQVRFATEGFIGGGLK